MRNPMVLVGGAIALIVILLVYLAANDSDRRLDNSVMGTNGLSSWLRSNKIEIIRTSGRDGPQRDAISMAILPLYDIDLSQTAREPRDDAERMSQNSPRDDSNWVIGRMMDEVPTLIVLPKWRQGFAMTGIAHEQTMIPEDEVGQLLLSLPLTTERGVAAGRSSFVPRENRMVEGEIVGVKGLNGRRIALFRPQLLDRSQLNERRCVELAGLPEGALLVACRNDRGASVEQSYFLSDPDIVNNHGLRLAENATLAIDIVNHIRNGDDRAVLMAQLAVHLVHGDDAPEPHKRSGEDLARFFDWPLSALWAMSAIVLGLAVWRGARRFGPPQGADPDRSDSSRRAAVAAKARLLRLSGADARMAVEHVRAHLADLAVQALGPGAANEPGIARWFALMDRRDPALAAQIRDAATRITPQTHPADLPRLIETFHALTRKATDAA